MESWRFPGRKCVFKGWGLHNLCGQPVPVLSQHFSEILLLCLDRISSLSVFSPLPLVLSLDTPKRAHLSLVYILPPGMYIKAPWAFLSPVPSLSAFPHRGDALVPKSPFWSSTGVSPVYGCISCTGEASTGHSTTGMASSVLLIKFQRQYNKDVYP